MPRSGASRRARRAPRSRPAPGPGRTPRTRPPTTVAPPAPQRSRGATEPLLRPQRRSPRAMRSAASHRRDHHDHLPAAGGGEHRTRAGRWSGRTSTTWHAAHPRRATAVAGELSSVRRPTASDPTGGDAPDTARSGEARRSIVARRPAQRHAAQRHSSTDLAAGPAPTTLDRPRASSGPTRSGHRLDHPAGDPTTRQRHAHHRPDAQRRAEVGGTGSRSPVDRRDVGQDPHHGTGHRRSAPVEPAIRDPAPNGQRVDAVGALPGEAVAGATEVAVGSGVAEHRSTEIEVADDRSGSEVEDLADGRVELRGIDGVGAEGLDQHRDRVRHADRVGDLDLAPRALRPTATTFLATQRAA